MTARPWIQATGWSAQIDFNIRAAVVMLLLLSPFWHKVLLGTLDRNCKQKTLPHLSLKISEIMKTVMGGKRSRGVCGAVYNPENLMSRRT